VGYTGFFDANESDHRGAFIEIDNKLLDNRTELSQPKKREIGSKSKQADIYAYKQYIHEKVKEHRINTKLEAVEQMLAERKIPKDLEARLNSIDQQITTAEGKFSSRHHESEWSIELHQHSILCKYWLTSIKGMSSGYQTAYRTKELYNLLTKEQQEGVKRLLINATEETYPNIVAREAQRCVDYKRELLEHHQELRIKACNN
jgi:hypothetical protein